MECDSMKVLARNITPFIIHNELMNSYSGVDYNLMESIAKYFQIKAAYERVKLSGGITMDEKL